MAQASTPWPGGDGEMAARIRSFDWAATPLGPIARWPQSLRTIVDLMLGSRSMMSLVWGPQAIHLYNDRFTELLREHRILALGQSAFETFARSRGTFAADVAAGMAGRSARLPAQRYPVLRRGRLDDAWFDVDYTPIRDETGAVAGVLWILRETTAQYLAEQALRESEARHRLLIDSWAQAEWETDADGIVTADSPSWRAYTGQTREEWLGFGWLSAIHPDDRAHAERQWREAIRVRGRVNAEFRLRAPDGGWRWTNVLATPVLDADGTVRNWAGMNIDIHARRRAEEVLRESEERFRQFADASATGLWIRDAETLAMEFVSPAVAAIYGVGAGALLGDVKHWASMIVPEDREVALGHLDMARRGEVAVHEFRIRRPRDGAFRWIRSTAFPLGDNGRIPRVGGIADDITETRALAEHRSVLLAELQHRVRNIMGMIRSMANRTAPGAASAEEYRTLLEGRLLALARVQALLTREANAGGSLRSLIESEVAAQAHHGGQFTLSGPDIHLAPKAVEVLTLAFHELATNALKYGALSVSNGRLAVSWRTVEGHGTRWLALDWIEEGGPSRGPQTRRGFGSDLIEGRIPYELSGRGQLTIAPDGARCRIEFPLRDAESILETDAPQPATIFGGVLDMAGAPDLTGRTILVVEDDYFLASDTAVALRGAGAHVLGPCPGEETTRDLLRTAWPTHAVVDLNLGGGGPRFEIAQLLKERGVPFVFLTGYDSDVIPEDMKDVLRLQKPMPFRDIVEAVSLL